MATKRASVIPGEASQEAHAPAPPAAAEADPRSLSMGLPDFTSHSAAYAAQWFKEHPEARKRNVLTAEGWYVHPEHVAAARGMDRANV